MLALAAPLPAFAVSELTATSESQVSQLSVSTSLESCGLLETQLICTLNVSFEPIPGATGYSASVTRADGSVMDAGSVEAGGSSIFVPYVGSGSYSVRVTAFGEPEPVEAGGDEVGAEVIASDAAEATAEVESGGDADRDGGRQLDAASAATVESEAGPRGELPIAPAGDPGETQIAPNCTEAAADAGADADATAAATPATADELPPLPELPPEDLDPNDPDEDDDTILDEQELIDYDAAAVARDEAVARIQAAALADC